MAEWRWRVGINDEDLNRRGRDKGAGRHYDSRPSAEQILEVACPKCLAAPGVYCDRRADLPRSPVYARLLAERTPPSHQERKWVRQGHDPSEFAALWARERRAAGRRPGTTGMASPAPPPRIITNAAREIADRVPCPRCGRPKGALCVDRSGDPLARCHEARVRLAEQRWLAKQDWRHKRKAAQRRVPPSPPARRGRGPLADPFAFLGE